MGFGVLGFWGLGFRALKGVQAMAHIGFRMEVNRG